MTDFVSGDTIPGLEVTCKNPDGVVIDLTGCTVKLRWKEADGTSAEGTMTVEDAAGGICSYQFLDGELYAPSMAFEVKITDANGKLLRNPNLMTCTVREAL